MAGAEGIIKIPELRKRILFTLAMFAVYRVGVHIPTPGINTDALRQVFQNMQGTLFGWFNIFNGGALSRFSVFALGVMPYISSAIIFELLTVVWPYLHELQKEGEQGQKKITQYTRYGSVALCLVQGYGIATGLEHYTTPSVVLHPGFGFRIFTALTLTAGSTFLMWVGEQMSERGIGNGISLLIFAGIAARMPSGLSSVVALYHSGEMSFFKLLAIAVIIVVAFYVIVYIEQGARRIPVQYAKRIVGRKVYGGQNTNLPMKVNTAGVIPPIFASSLIMFPATFAAFFPTERIKELSQMLNPSSIIYDVMYVGLIIFFCYFYTAVTFKTEDVADNLKKYGGFIPGIRPGPPTAKYIEYVLSRITLGGAVYIATVCVLPMVLTAKAKVPFYFGGTSILILIEVGLDTVAQIETFLLTRNYDGFMKHTRVRSRAFT